MQVDGRKVPLTVEEMNTVRGYLTDKRNRVVVDMFNVEMSTERIQCLRKRTWLNDEVINFYMELLKVICTYIV